jgi:hypothetical protein
VVKNAAQLSGFRAGSCRPLTLGPLDEFLPMELAWNKPSP